MEDQIIRLGEFLIWGILGSAAFLLILKAATGRINLRGLLGTGTGSGISPARVQFLFLTLIGAFVYLGVVITAISTLPPLRLHGWHVEHPAVLIGYSCLTSRRIEFCPTTGPIGAAQLAVSLYQHPLPKSSFRKESKCSISSVNCCASGC